MEWIKSLNDYAGLFALLALLATFVVPIIIYKVQKKDERQAMQDEYDAMMGAARFPMSAEQRCFAAKKQLLEKRLKK